MEPYLGRRRIVIVTMVAFVVLAALVAAGCGAPAASTPGSTSNPSAAPSGVAGSGTTVPAAALPRLAHIFIIVMENHPASDIIGNPDAPFINSLAKQYALAANYSAVFHPSLPNYLALTSGSNQGITDDRGPVGNSVDAPNIADRIEASGRTWKLYGESMPSPGATSNTGVYATKHIPFLYYNDILGNQARLTSHVVPFTQLATDLKSAATTPNYAFITPNLVNDMHDGTIAQGDAWLAGNVPVILKSPAFTGSAPVAGAANGQAGSLLVITWDEGSSSDNHVVTIFAGNAAKTGYSSSRAYDHYSLLHTIEGAWGLEPLTPNDAAAALMGELLRN